MYWEDIIMDYGKIKEAAQGYEQAMTKFLRDLVRIPGESVGEEGHVKRIEQEMNALGFDKVVIDPMGNILGYMGTGKTLIGFDAHIDTVGIGNRDNWDFDPYEGFESDTEIGGRGTSDQLGGIVSAVYGAKIMKDQGLLDDRYTVLVTGTVQEEDCDGLCWQYIVNEDKVRPEFVVSTEPTDGGIYRGQRGRMEIFFTSPSRCAVAYSCAISLDRRMTAGETWESCLDEIRALPSVKKYGAKVSMYNYERPSWTGLTYPTECYFPTWVIPEDHKVTEAMAAAYTELYGEPRIDKWTFSTNGVSIMGRFGIPCIGFGPGKEAQAHAPNEKTWKEDLVRCAAVYAALPTEYCK